MWKCIGNCGKLMGGGDKWYCNEDMELDICIDCFPNVRNSFIVCEDNSNFIWIDRGCNLVRVDLSPVEHRLIPECISDEITIDRMKMWVENIDSIANLDPEFGPYKQWTMFTDYDDEDLFKWGVGTCLAVDCGVDTSGRIASVLYDNHGRISIDIIFKNMEDYNKSLSTWNQNKLTSDAYKKIYDKVYKDLNDKSECDDDELASVCTEFSSYIRIENRLGLYYG